MRALESSTLLTLRHCHSGEVFARGTTSRLKWKNQVRFFVEIVGL